jgi:hypothetical protein
MECEHEFRRDGSATIDGQELQKFIASVKMTLDGSESSLVKLGNQTGDGTLYFDAKHGRVTSSQWSVTAQLLFGGGEAEGQMKVETKSEIHERENRKAK